MVSLQVASPLDVDRKTYEEFLPMTLDTESTNDIIRILIYLIELLVHTVLSLSPSSLI